jgi:prepilin-type N-terminal cleavage/methylation domain-containing protein
VLKMKRKSDAFTLVELLLGLAITAILLVAVAAALNASVVNYKANEDIYKAMNDARQAMTRMTSQLRTANAVDFSAPANQCSFFTATNEDTTYEFRSADNKLYLITNVNGNEYVLCDNVTAATFTKTDDGTKCKSVQISLTVTVGSISQSLSGASVIRRNLQ